MSVVLLPGASLVDRINAAKRMLAKHTQALVIFIYRHNRTGLIHLFKVEPKDKDEYTLQATVTRSARDTWRVNEGSPLQES